jgi:hypothetical protein
MVFGEWCGGNIQKAVAITQLPKMFVVFGIALVDAEEKRFWLDSEFVKQACDRVFVGTPALKCIYDFPCYTMEIDFARPHDYQNPLSELTLKVEEECPVGKALGANPEKGPMTGEGIVWKCITSGFRSSKYWFKVKGEEHAAGNKVNTLAQVDVQRIDDIQKLAVQLTPNWRLDQMFQKTFDTLNGGQPHITGTGEYIKNVMQDILKEELPVIAASGFNTKEITGAVSKIARTYFLAKLHTW